MHLHQGQKIKLGIKKGHKNALLKNLAASLILHERIKTTLPKAKKVKPFIERLISVGKKGDLSARRTLLKFLPPNAAAKLVEEIGETYKDSQGGYLRILKLPPRVGDNAPMALLELVKKPEAPGVKEEKQETKEEAPKEEIKKEKKLLAKK